MRSERSTFDYFLTVLLGTTDFLSIYGAYILSYFIYNENFGTLPQSLSQIAVLSLLPAGLGFVSFVLTGVYRCQPGPMGLDQLRRLLLAYFWSGLITFSLTFFTKSYDYSRIMVTSGFSFGVMFVLLGRALFVRFTRRVKSVYSLNRRILILGAGKVGFSLARNLFTTASDAELIGYLDDQYPQVQSVVVRVGENDRVIPILGTLNDIEPLARKYRANEVIVAMTQAAQALHQSLFERVQDLNISFSIVPSALDLMLTGAEAYSIGRIPLFRLGKKPIFILSPVLKRTFDVVGALIIGILSSPIWIVSSLLIKLDSVGPALFVHERVGKDGKKFFLYKFRSMHLNTHPYELTPQNQLDARITPIGRFLRRTSIDEIPQLLNVLKGDMSLVGPRPEMPFIVDHYDELQKLRLSVKPGLTGVWQISADRANPIHENLDYDLYYLENQSFWLDLAILIKTLTSVLKGVGAY